MVLHSVSVPLAANALTTTVTCDAGQAIGGGFVTTNGGVNLTGSIQSASDPTSWVLSFDANPGAGTARITCAAG